MLRAKLIAAQMAKVKVPGAAGAGAAGEEPKNHFADEFDINDYPVQVLFFLILCFAEFRRTSCSCKISMTSLRICVNASHSLFCSSCMLLCVVVRWICRNI